jgi:hypothetical protein
MRYSILVTLGAVCAGALLSAEAITTEPLANAVPVKEAMDLVLDEKDAHVDVETRYVNEDQLLREIGERLVQEGRERVVKAAETKYVMSIALEIKACKTKHVVDERAQQACINKIRDEVLGPVPTRDDVDVSVPTRDGVDASVNQKSKLDEILARHPVHTESPPEPQDPVILKRVLQTYAAKRESMNLLRNELKLVQKLGRVLTGEALDGEVISNIESAALLARARKQSRATVSELVKLNLMPKTEAAKVMKAEKKQHPNRKEFKEPVALAGMAMDPEPSIPPPVVVPPVKPATEWELYKAKLDHAAQNEVHGLGPNGWNPTHGETFEGEVVGASHHSA